MYKYIVINTIKYFGIVGTLHFRLLSDSLTWKKKSSFQRGWTKVLGTEVRGDQEEDEEIHMVQSGKTLTEYEEDKGFTL